MKERSNEKIYVCYVYDDLSELERKCALKALNNMKKEINNAYNLLDSLK